MHNNETKKPLELLILGDKSDNTFHYLPKKICDVEINTTCITRGYSDPDHYLTCLSNDEEFIRKVVRNGGELIVDEDEGKVKYFLKDRFLVRGSWALDYDEIDTPAKIASHADKDHGVLEDTWSVQAIYIDGPEARDIKEHTRNKSYDLIMVPNNTGHGVKKAALIHKEAIPKTIVVCNHDRSVMDIKKRYEKHGITDIVKRPTISGYLLARFFETENIFNYLRKIETQEGKEYMLETAPAKALCNM